MGEEKGGWIMVMAPMESDVEKFVEDAKAHHQRELDILGKYQRLVDYLAAAQIYLQGNALLKGGMKKEDVKPRLLGHWGTCPGINVVYSHLNRMIVNHACKMLLVTGPGHGAPANLANLYLEGSLGEFYPEMTLDEAGLNRFVRAFSWPGGFPSHLYAGLPGTIHEGGELGYALATAFGAVMDNPDLIACCIVGDGEAETGPTAGAWHSHKFIDPAESGAVLPILHVNGYKIANPTLFGTMSNGELLQLFHGYGWRPVIVGPNELNPMMLAAMEWAYHEIKLIQEAARNGDPIEKPKWPLIIMRSPKGLGGIKELDGKKIEGSHLSHQVPAKDLLSNKEHFKAVEAWLKSYKVEELFEDTGAPKADVLSLCPKGDLRLGMCPETFGGKVTQPLEPQDIFQFAVGKGKFERGKLKVSNVGMARNYVASVVKANPHTFRIFSPDELESNKLNVFDVTHRQYQWPVAKHDTDIGKLNGRVIEVLSEHNLQGWMQGYVLTGRHALFPSYEAFFGIIATMMDQYAKFIKMSEEVEWRKPVPSLNYLSTSTHWRQEHNGFSHQNPGFLNTLLNKKGETVRIYLPPDANCMISTLDHCFRSKNYVNLVIGTKVEMPQWLTMDEAVAHCRAGASIWHWASIDEGIDPDVVMVGIGDDVTLEVMAAAKLLREMCPELRLRVVNVTDLLVLEKNSKHPHGMTQGMFENLLTPDRPVIFNFHGYPSAMQHLLFGRGPSQRFWINGYQEEGTTTTPFDMTIRNHSSRFHLMIQAIQCAAKRNSLVEVRANELISWCEYQIRDHRHYIQEHGADPKAITDWSW